MIDSARIYRSHRDAARMLHPLDRLAFFEAVMDYALDGKAPDIEGPALMLFTAIKPTLDNRTEKAEAGKRGGRPKTTGCETKKPMVSESENHRLEKPKSYTDTDTDTDTDSDTDKREKRKRFTPPTLEELRSYIREKGYTFDAETFIAYYESNGWKIGRNPMKDWKAACRTWQQKEKERRKPAVQQVEPRAYDMDELEAAIYRAQSAAV